MDKVFCSEITRSHNKHKNDLYELLKIVPAKPISVSPKKTDICDFQPRIDKQYVPKPKSKLKVKTVRDIRSIFEKDTCNDLPNELERQENFLLRKIRCGSSRADRTKALAKNMLCCDKPITKSSWQMLMNINPDNHPHSTQYVLWNGKLIRVNGSKGGKNKFIFNHDLGKNKEPLKNYNTFHRKNVSTQKGLLRNSLLVNFKPGPLSKKKFLDKSHQKHNLGDIELVTLPKPGLEIQPAYGSAVDSTVLNILSSFREVDGLISEKWAEFSVSALGLVKDSVISPIDKVRSVTFNLNYKCNQRRILMRRDLITEQKFTKTKGSKHTSVTNEFNILPEVQKVLSDILDSVDISLNQNSLFTEADEVRCMSDNMSSQHTNHVKEKGKRKYGELGRLDVTVIRVSENAPDNEFNVCRNDYCRLGCVCSSLKCDLTLKAHCGRTECIFQCKCGYLKYKAMDTLDGNCPDYLPEIINLDNEINNTLAKEEQKFHQTVIVTGDKSILLKSKKRNRVSSKKYADFYSNMHLKSKLNTKPILTIIAKKINCQNIEPWCMVHNLYKCFCRGQFTETSNKTINETVINLCDLFSDDCKKDQTLAKNENNTVKKRDLDVKHSLCEINNKGYENTYRTRRKQRYIEQERDGVPYVTLLDRYDPDDYNICARIKPFKRRKYSKRYYLNTGYKIQSMEVNDSNLSKRLLYLLHKSLKSKKCDGTLDESLDNDLQIGSHDDSYNKRNTENANENEDQPDTLSEGSNNSVEKENQFHKSNFQDEQSITINPSSLFDGSKISNLEMVETSTENRIASRPKLVAWLESSYQQYKKQVNMGINRNTLEAPKKGKVALYPWDFILNRYSERKNLFLVSNQKPFRIFMAVNNKSPFFENCMNIDDIRFADLNNYPLTVKSLLTNTTGLNDYFCILLGLNECWELIGSVTKVSDKKGNAEDEVSETITIHEDQNNIRSPLDDVYSSISDDNESIKTDKLHTIAKETSMQSDSSKWFVMTVENDFTEIQFYNRGFFVKYDSIMRAINVARMSSKTVRLSSQKCMDKNSGPQFGIYAIPNANECCVFVGPYETNEQLGIETVKTIANLRKQKRTRGVWIQTDKVDNLKVIDNPLSFLPSQNVDYSEMLPIENDLTESCNTPEQTEAFAIDSNEPKEQVVKKLSKTIKPIKIRKTNGFYHLSSNTFVKTLSTSNLPQTSTSLQSNSLESNLNTNSKDISIEILPTILQPGPQTKLPVQTDSPLSLTTYNVSDQKKKPVAEVAPQIKIAAVYSEAPTRKQSDIKKSEGVMFILKPEEINKRLAENKIFSGADLNQSNSLSESNDVEDIEEFLDKSLIIGPVLPTETVVISDDEEDEPISFKDIWLECQNINNLGLISGQMNKDGLIRFQFPGFRFTDFYKKDVAFAKINQVLSRKVYIPKNLTLEWSVVESLEAAKSFRMFSRKDLGPDFILTRHGIQHKNDLVIYSKSDVKTYSRERPASLKSNNAKHEKEVITKQGLRKIKRDDKSEIKTYSRKGHSALKGINNEKSEEMDDITFQQKSKSLEDESSALWSQTIIKKEEIAKFMTEASHEDRQQFTESLQNIINLAEED